MGRVTLWMCLRAAPQERERIETVLLSAVGPTRVKRGCTGCHIGRDLADDHVVLYREEWESRETMTRHIRSQEFWNVLLAMDMSVEEPTVQLDDTVSRSGMDTLLQIRNGSAEWAWSEP